VGGGSCYSPCRGIMYYVLGAAAKACEPGTRAASSPGRQPPVRRRGRGASPGAGRGHRPPNTEPRGPVGSSPCGPMLTPCQPHANRMLTPCQPHANPMPTPCQPHANANANPMRPHSSGFSAGTPEPEPSGPGAKLDLGPPGPHPAQPSSSLDPGGERWPISPPLAPLIAQLVQIAGGRGGAGNSESIRTKAVHCTMHDLKPRWFTVHIGPYAPACCASAHMLQQASFVV
jgi:hypothetical protein